MMLSVKRPESWIFKMLVFLAGESVKSLYMAISLKPELELEANEVRLPCEGRVDGAADPFLCCPFGSDVCCCPNVICRIIIT